jgi:hypothetical protein
MQQLGHLAEHGAEGVHGYLSLAVQDLHEPGHVRALEIVGEVHVHVEIRDRVLLAPGAVLDPNGMEDVLDADLVDGYPAGVGVALDILDGGHGGLLGGGYGHFR